MNKLLMSLVLSQLLTPLVAQARPAAALAVEVTVAPRSDGKELQVNAMITDAGTQEILGRPVILLARGENASITTELPDASEVILSVTTSVSKSQFEYEVQHRERGRLKAVQRAKIDLGG